MDMVPLGTMSKQLLYHSALSSLNQCPLGHTCATSAAADCQMHRKIPFAVAAAGQQHHFLGKSL
jgi:hypothetical protein